MTNEKKKYLSKDTQSFYWTVKINSAYLNTVYIKKYLKETTNEEFKIIYCNLIKRRMPVSSLVFKLRHG